MARQLIESLESEWKPEKYTDDHDRHLRAMIQAKLKGKKITAAREPASAEPKVLDLMGKLRESLERGAKSTSSEGARPARDETAHRKAHTRVKRSSRKAAARRTA